MDLRLTLVDRRRVGAATDVLVRAEPGTPFAAVVPELRRLCPDGDGFAVAGRAVPPDAVVGLPPVVEGAVLAAGSGTSSLVAPGLISLDVVAGPGAGASVPLGPGRVTLGRSVGAGVRLADADVSQQHAELSIEGGEVLVRDLGSTNGTWLGGERVPETWVRVSGPVRVGACLLAVRGPDEPAARTEPDGSGGLVVAVPPLLRAPWEAPTVEFPAEPVARSERIRIPWPAMLLPVLVAVPLAWWWHSPAALLLALTGPLITLAQVVVDRRDGGRRRRRERAEYEVARAAAQELLDDVGLRFRGELETVLPDLTAVAACAVGPGLRLWERSGSEPLVRLGLGAVPVEVSVVGREPPVLLDAPVGLALPPGSVVGVCGPQREAVVRAIVGQLAVAHPPAQLRLAVDVRGGAWAWTRWLPHAVEDAAEADVAVVDGTRARRALPRLPEGVVLCLDQERAWLPASCTTLIETGEVPTLTRGDGSRVPFRPDLPPPGWAIRIGRALAPLRASPAGAVPTLPSEVRLVDLLADRGLDATDPGEVLRTWTEDHALRVPIGTAAAAPCFLDLRRDGPHALIGGTTGSGKSELLRTIVTALAATHPPEAVTFLLVDYKGGTAFAACADLPHTAGLITDLDPALAERALASLGTELRRRERILRAAGVGDLADLPAAAPPRLVIVVDEFRALAQDLPDFVEGLVRVAATGRSLGVHLILATQRPAGVVSADMRANLGLRIALRMRDAPDSTDVLEAPDAAAFPAVPGRAAVRTPEGDLTPFQTAHLSRSHRGHTPTVTVLGPGGRPLVPLPLGPGVPGAAAPTPADLDLVVAATREAARRRGSAPAVSPWLPPLPARLDASDLPAVAGGGRVALGGGEAGRSSADGVGGSSGTGTAPAQLPLGLCDRPERQEQPVFVWPLRPGRHLAVVGGPGSGRSTALTAMAAAAPPEVAVLVLDGSGALAELEGHVADAVIPATDVERGARLLRRLREGHPTLLLVDGWESLVAAWEPVEHGRMVDELIRLLRDGAVHGLSAALGGGRGLLSGPVASLTEARLVLRMPDPADLAIAGVSPRRVPAAQPPGRAVLLSPADRDGVLVQLALPRSPTARRTPTLPSLPRHVRLESLTGTPQVVAWGVGGDDVGVVGLDADRLGGVLVVGRPGSGRTTALATLSASLARAGWPVLSADEVRRGVRGAAAPSGSLTPSAHTSGTPSAHPSGGTGSGPSPRPGTGPDAAHGRGPLRGAVLIDDAGGIDAALDAALSAHLARGLGPVVLAVDPQEAATAYRGVLAEVRATRTGLLLGPLGPGESEVLGIRVTSLPDTPAGRGHLVRGGRATAVQIATTATQHPGE